MYMVFINGKIHFKYNINMIARKKTYNSIARSFRSKPSLFNLFFFSKNGRQIKNWNQERDIPAEYFHNNKLAWNMLTRRCSYRDWEIYLPREVYLPRDWMWNNIEKQKYINISFLITKALFPTPPDPRTTSLYSLIFTKRFKFLFSNAWYHHHACNI